MYVCVCMSVLNKSKKNNSKTAYKDHNFFFNFIYFCLEIRKSFKKNKKIYIYISRSSFTKIFKKNIYLFEKSY